MYICYFEAVFECQLHHKWLHSLGFLFFPNWRALFSLDSLLSYVLWFFFIILFSEVAEVFLLLFLFLLLLCTVCMISLKIKLINFTWDIHIRSKLHSKFPINASPLTVQFEWEVNVTYVTVIHTHRVPISVQSWRQKRKTKHQKQKKRNVSN